MQCYFFLQLCKQRRPRLPFSSKFNANSLHELFYRFKFTRVQKKTRQIREFQFSWEFWTWNHLLFLRTLLSRINKLSGISKQGCTTFGNSLTEHQGAGEKSEKLEAKKQSQQFWCLLFLTCLRELQRFWKS